MHKLYELKDKLIEELEDYSENGKFSKEDVETIKYMASAVDHICNICNEEEEDDVSYADGMGGNMGGASYRYSRDGRMYRGGRPYRGMSYARGRRNVPRDSMGRYSGADGEESLEDIKRDVQKLAEKVEQM